MSRIATRFEALKQQGRKALIPYITAGYPQADITPELMHALVASGCDLIELGVPFSDPSADGVKIQQANEKALAMGINLPQVLQMVRTFREKDEQTPVILMGYANPIERYEIRFGPGAFARDSAACGVDGILTVDYPPQEAAVLDAQLRAVGLDSIFLLAPTSTRQRMQQLAELASGFIYYVSLRGVTGANTLDTQEVARMVEQIREIIPLPIGVGFGIRDAQTAVEVARHADGVIIGSQLLQEISEAPENQIIHAAQVFLAPIRQALDELSA